VARTIEGLTLDEVAELHGVSVSTAQRRIERATARMALLVRRDPLLAAFAGGGAP
jgi:DNA-directed RNA polymerase specialized sigma24 family protein